MIPEPLTPEQEKWKEHYIKGAITSHSAAMEYEALYHQAHEWEPRCRLAREAYCRYTETFGMFCQLGDEALKQSCKEKTFEFSKILMQLKSEAYGLIKEPQ